MPGEVSRARAASGWGLPPSYVYLYKVRYDHTVPHGYVHHMTEYVGARDEDGAIWELRRSMPYGRTKWRMDVLEVKRMGPYDLLTAYCRRCEAYVGEALAKDGVCDQCRLPAPIPEEVAP